MPLVREDGRKEGPVYDVAALSRSLGYANTLSHKEVIEKWVRFPPLYLGSRSGV